MLIAESLRERRFAITVPELATMLSISQRQIYKMAATNRIPNFKIGTSVRFDPDALREWLQEKTLTVPGRRPPTSVRPYGIRTSRVA
jgi:excisionase family DNA binding protein